MPPAAAVQAIDHCICLEAIWMVIRLWSLPNRYEPVLLQHRSL